MAAVPEHRPGAGMAGGAESAGRHDWEQRRNEILDAAAEVFFERGFERGTTKEIAARVGLTQPSIYHYVGSKDDLITEIARRVDSDFGSIMDDVSRVEGDPPAQLRALVHHFVERLARNRVLFAVYWKEYRAIPRDVARAVSADQRRFIEQVTELVKAAQAAGVMPADQPAEVLTEGILGMMAWMYWWYRPDGPHSPEAIADAFCALLRLDDPGRHG